MTEVALQNSVKTLGYSINDAMNIYLPHRQQLKKYTQKNFDGVKT